jgi:hypothetical protein
MWRYRGFSGVVNVWSSFDLIVKLIIPVPVLFCLVIMLAPGLGYLDWASILETSPDKLLTWGPIGRFRLIMWILAPLILFITVLIDIIILIGSIIDSLPSWDWNIGIWDAVCLFGLFNFVSYIVYLFIDSKRRQQKD